MRNHSYIDPDTGETVLVGRNQRHKGDKRFKQPKYDPFDGLGMGAFITALLGDDWGNHDAYVAARAYYHRMVADKEPQERKTLLEWLKDNKEDVMRALLAPAE